MVGEVGAKGVRWDAQAQSSDCFRRCGGELKETRVWFSSRLQSFVKVQVLNDVYEADVFRKGWG